MSSASKASNSSGAKETVLLRKPAPKYGFSGRKLPKEPAVAPSIPSSSTSPLPPSGSSVGTKSQQAKPVAVVGASFHSHASSVADFRAKGENPGSTPDDQSTQLINSTASSPNLIAKLQNEAHHQTASNFEPTLSPGKPIPDSSASQPEWYLSSPNTHSSASLAEESTGETDTDTSFSIQSLNEQLQATKEERDKLRTELNAQLQVNTELKRLLVASVGDDLYERVENLCRDRAQLELDIGGFSKKMSEDYENLDKVSIQADMWRSKYLASRVMTEELSSAKAYYSLQCHDSHTALQQLLNERQELRTNLVES